jgi:alginate O-acetyltransferase complex protein AlgJ
MLRSGMKWTIVAVMKERAVVLLFLLFIVTPMLVTLSGVNLFPLFRENRTLARFPRDEVESGHIKKFIDGFEKYVDDRFGFRPYLISGLGYLKYSIGVSGNPAVITGKNYYLFSGGSAWDLADYRGISPRNPQLLENWRVALKQRQKWLAAMGTHFLLTIPPVKETVYPEMLPDWLKREGNETRVGHLLEYLEGSGIDVLYLKEPLISAKGHGQLYYKADTHWTNLGAFFGARAILRHLSQSFPAIKAPDLDQYEVKHVDIGQNESGIMDLCLQLGIMACKSEDYLIIPKGGWTAKQTVIHTATKNIYIYEKDDPRLPTLVVYGDSYAWAMQRVLAEHFRRAYFFNPWEGIRGPEEQFPVEPVAIERPDILIYSRMGRGVPALTGNAKEIRDYAYRH